ncbi:HAMP domain-containing histidine kinase [Luteolibacter flavescens]|uniref:histidine kinase n=1 Tax=Luteolibacter flavescens TaxID=1859460 RepID=A0ABT3FVI5_9BACT|nr:HAMP domain-containing sensor histidine kinase [Luteolibacter flavescens]MCW1887552.1 HAMP domain-containing histidine kinase [Luteolibacter flavescens]
MRAPSLRLRLILASVLVIAVVLGLSKVSLYREIRHSLEAKVDSQLLSMAHVLAKTSELEATGVQYEWQEALKFDDALKLGGLFQFHDLKTGLVTRSPELGAQTLEFFDGGLNEPVFKNVLLPDGSPARAVALQHLPFINDHGLAEMERRGVRLHAKDFPQVLVYASSMTRVEAILHEARLRLWRTGLMTLAATSLVISLVIRWMVQPLKRLAADLAKHTAAAEISVPEMPRHVPSELVPLVSSFREALRQAQTARAHERELASHAAHQLRTPLAGIHSILELAIIKDGDRDDLLRRIEAALVETRQMRETLSGLLQLARLRGGAEEAGSLPFDASALVTRLLAQEQEREGNSRRVETSGLEQEQIVRGDPALVSIMISNLLGNAFHHSPANGLIRVEMDAGGSSIVFRTINPRGALKEEDLERILQPFQRGADVPVDMPGAGLGLPLAKEIAEKSGGGLRVYLRGESVVFEASLPRG